MNKPHPPGEKTAPLYLQGSHGFIELRGSHGTWWLDHSREMVDEIRTSDIVGLLQWIVIMDNHNS